MSIIVTDTGFAEDDWSAEICDFDQLSQHTNATAVNLPSDFNANDLSAFLGQLHMIRVDFPSFSDGRGFTVARLLRLMGYAGCLRARGYVISDQYTMARRCGFDEVEISDEQASRQPEHQWLFRAAWQQHHYQQRLSINSKQIRLGSKVL